MRRLHRARPNPTAAFVSYAADAEAVNELRERDLAELIGRMTPLAIMAVALLNGYQAMTPDGVARWFMPERPFDGRRPTVDEPTLVRTRAAFAELHLLNLAQPCARVLDDTLPPGADDPDERLWTATQLGERVARKLVMRVGGPVFIAFAKVAREDDTVRPALRERTPDNDIDFGKRFA